MSQIHSRRWEAAAGVARRPRGIYLFHGTGEHCGRYEHVANALASQGFVVGAHDHPSHGQSAGERGKLYPPGAYATQAGIQFMRFAKETGSTPILLGHSLGGVLASELVLMHGLQVHALVLSAPAFLPFVSTTNKIKLHVMNTFAPNHCLELPYDATRLTHDKDMVAASHADKLNHGYKSAAKITWLIRTGKEALVHASTLDVDTLMLVPGDDPVVDPEGSKRFAANAPNDKVTLKLYPGAYHELFNEIPEIREQVIAEMIEWLDKIAPVET